MSTILPANSSLLELALDTVAGELIDRIAPPFPALMNPAETPAEFLPYLATDRGVAEWSNAATEPARRQMVTSAWEVSRLAGTRHALRRALAAAGYPLIGIQSAGEYRDQWQLAGGEFLDGTGDMSSGDLSSPPGSFRFVASHWAEYAVNLNTADLPLSGETLRRVRALCEAYGPLRSRLGAIILSLSAEFSAVMLLSAYRGRARMRLADCRRISVPSFDTLDGCDLLGGETLPDLLDGVGTLSGDSGLLPERHLGEPLDAGQLGIAGRLRSGFQAPALGGNRQEPLERLDSTDLLDGGYTIAAETLDGVGLIDRGDLRYPTLADHESTLDGTSNLGEVSGPDHVWISGLVRIRRGSTTTQETL